MVVGTIFMFAGTTAPEGYIICDGSAVSRTTYSDLFEAIGTTYGIGDGSTTFNLPDLSGRVPIGCSGVYPLASTGGEETHTLTTTEIPSHSHGVPKHGHANTITATTPAFSHTITQPAYNYNKPNGTVGTSKGNSAAYAGTTSTTATRSANVAIAAHAATNCTMSGSVTAKAAFSSDSNGSGTAHSNMQPYITMNYIICTGV